MADPIIGKRPTLGGTTGTPSDTAPGAGNAASNAGNAAGSKPTTPGAAGTQAPGATPAVTDAVEAARPTVPSGVVLNEAGTVVGSEPASVDAGLLLELAGLPSGQPVVMRANGMGDTQALLHELAQALVHAPEQSEAILHAALGIAALAEHAPERLPALLVDQGDSFGVRLHVAERAAAGQTDAAANSNALASSDQSQFIAVQPQSVQSAAARSGTDMWPYMLLQALPQVLQSEQLLQQQNALARTMATLLGQPMSSLDGSAGAEALFRAASLANAPLRLPIVATLQTVPGGAARGFVVSSTSIGADGKPMFSLLDVASMFEGGVPLRTTMTAEMFAKLVTVMVVPDGRPALLFAGRHEEALARLGLAGCCLTSGRGGSVGQKVSSPAGAQPERGNGDGHNRCMTCPVAQQMCVPQG